MEMKLVKGSIRDCVDLRRLIAIDWKRATTQFINYHRNLSF